MNNKLLARRMDPIHAMLLGNLIWGLGLGLVFAFGVYALDLGHIRTLVHGSREGVLAMSLLCVGSMITFASVVMGGAVMLIPRPEDERKPPRGKNVLLRALVPVRVHAAAPAQGMGRHVARR